MESRRVTLKNGKEVDLSLFKMDDFDNLIHTITTYVSSSPFIPINEDEFVLDLESKKSWVQSLMDEDNSVLIVAKHEGQIIGNIDLNGNASELMRHTASLGIGMLSNWRGLGLGSALFDMALEWASHNPILELVWLESFESNHRGVNLYKKKGFKISGKIRNFFKVENSYCDKILMTKMV